MQQRLFFFSTAMIMAASCYLILAIVFLHTHTRSSHLDILPSVYGQLRPEYDIPLYLGSLLLIPIIGIGFFATFCYVSSLFPKSTVPITQRLLSCCSTLATILLFLLLILAGALSVSQSFSTARFFVDSFQHYSYLFFTGYTPIQGVISMLTLFSLFWIRYQWFTKKKILSLRTASIIDGFVISGIITFVFLVLPTTSQAYAPLDYTFVMGPIHDVLKGKVLLVNSHSQYGLLMVYTLSWIFHLIPFGYASFFFLNAVTTILGYIAIYALSAWWWKSRFYASLAVLFLWQHQYTAQIQPILYFAQGTFLRFGMWLPTAALILARSHIPRSWQNRWRYLEAICVAIATFWGVDVGGYVLGSYSITLACDSLFRYHRKKDAFRHWGSSMVRLIGVLSIIPLFFSLYAWSTVHVFPHWSWFIESLFNFTNGWDMIPLPLFGAWNIILIGYFVLGSYLLATLALRIIPFPQSENLSMITFILTYGILQFLYYAGRSTHNNIKSILIPFILLVCWGLSRLEWGFFHLPWQRYSFHVRLQLGSLVLLIFLGLSMLTTVGTINTWEVIAHRNDVAATVHESARLATLEQSMPAVRDYSANLPKQEPIAIVSENDADILFDLDRVNVIDSNTLPFFIRTSQLQSLGNQLVQKNPSFVIIDHDNPSGRVDIIKHTIHGHYHPTISFGYFDIWERAGDNFTRLP